MPVEGAARAPYCVQVSCSVLLSLSPLIFGEFRAIVFVISMLGGSNFWMGVGRDHGN